MEAKVKKRMKSSSPIKSEKLKIIMKMNRKKDYNPPTTLQPKPARPKKEVLRRLKIIEGHLKKVIKMVEEDKYCIDILQQSLAVQNALKKADALILDQHLHQCVVDAFKNGKGRKEKSIKELLRVFELSKK